MGRINPTSKLAGATVELDFCKAESCESTWDTLTYNMNNELWPGCQAMYFSFAFICMSSVYWCLSLLSLVCLCLHVYMHTYMHT